MADHVILVVEDDDALRKHLVRALEEDGHTVLQASTGHETIRILEREPVSLVLTDRKMPWMDGDWLLEYVRANYPKIPVAFLTAYAEGVEELKPDAVLMKPFRRRELKQLVHTLIGNKKRNAEH